MGVLEGQHSGVDGPGIHFGLISLHIDDEVSWGKVERASGLGQTAGTTGVVDARHDDLGSEALAGIGDFGGVGSDHQAIE